MRTSILLRKWFWKITGKKSKSSERPDYDYYAFISYKHKKEDGQFEADSRWAKRLKIELEMMHISSPPVDSASIINEYDNTVSQVFRDDDVLSGGELTPAIQKALQSSKLLVIILSKQMVKDQNHWEEVSRKEKDILEAAFQAGTITEEEYQEKLDKVPKAWLKEEFNLFTNNGSENLENVCLVSIEGCPFSMDNPELVPRYLLGKVDGKRVISPYENFKDDPFSSVLPWKKQESKWGKNESHFVERTAAAIAAQIFGQNGDQFWSYRKKQKQARNLQWLLASLGVFIVVASLVMSLRIASSQNYLAKARRALADGNRKEAMECSLTAYQKWPFTQDITTTLWDALDPTDPFMSFESDIAINKAAGEFAVIRDKQYVDIYDFNTMSIVRSYDVGHGSSIKYSPDGTKLAVYSKKDLTIIDLKSDSLLRKKASRGNISSIRFSKNGEFITCDGAVYRLPDLESGSYFTSLPYYSFSSPHHTVSFMGTDDKIAIVTKACNISEHNPADTIWAIAVYDLNGRHQIKNLIYNGQSFSRSVPNIYLELPDSVSFAGAFANQPVLYYTTPHRVYFLELQDSCLIDKGWHKFDTPVKGWILEKENLVSEWNKRPERIVSAMSDRDGDTFILIGHYGMKYRLDSRHNITTLSPGFANKEDVSFYSEPFLATQDSLILFHDRLGSLHLSYNAPSEASLYCIPLSGIRLNNETEYSIQKHDLFQFVSEIHGGSDLFFKTRMYWDKDLREMSLTPLKDGMSGLYRSSDMTYALATLNHEFGVFCFQTGCFIPVCSTSIYSGIQACPLYQNGEKLYVLAASKEQPDCFDIAEVSLLMQNKRFILKGLRDVKVLPEGILYGRRNGKTVLYDLKHPVTEEVEYEGLIDIKKENSFFAVTRRTSLSDNHYMSGYDTLVYNLSTHLIPRGASEESAFIGTSPGGNYIFEVSFFNQTGYHDTVRYSFRGKYSSTPAIILTSDAILSSFYGITEDDRYFYYAKNGNLAIYDFKKSLEIPTTLRLDPSKIEKVTVAEHLLFFPGNTFKIVDLSNGKVLMSLPELESDWTLSYISFSPNLKWLLAGYYLIDLNAKQVISSTIPLDAERILTNDYIMYRDKALVLPNKRNLVKQAEKAIHPTT